MTATENDIKQLTDHLFRREAGRMVSVLANIFGAAQLEPVEDIVQETFLTAFQTWIQKGIPDNPTAWLFTVARNKALTSLKQNKRMAAGNDYLQKEDYSNSPFLLTDQFYAEELIQDDMLRMMFACCHPDISEENQVTFILKLLCGFSVGEIARAFCTHEETISKRLYRTREFFRQHNPSLSLPSGKTLQSRTKAVLHAIYLLFNEGYSSTRSDELIRHDLIQEAMMLSKLLVQHKLLQKPEAYALLALICFHSSRSASRLTMEGEIILLPDQDRSLWDRELIELGNYYMHQAAFGQEISVYHIEAAISFEHCVAADFNQTNWERILELLTWECRLISSPITELNRAIAIWKIQGAKQALNALNEIDNQESLNNYHIYHSFLGEIYLEMNEPEKAKSHFLSALEKTRSTVEAKLVRKKIDSISS